LYTYLKEKQLFGAGAGAVIRIYGSAEPEAIEIFTAPQHCLLESEDQKTIIVVPMLFPVSLRVPPSPNYPPPLTHCPRQSLVVTEGICVVHM
jgi:hypothetical protein